jgi:hypothetical protein
MFADSALVLENVDDAKPIYDDDDDDEDDGCEACGLFFTTPDASYHRFANETRQPASNPAIAFGLLKTLASLVPVKELNTSYHAAVEGRDLKPLAAECAFDCERGYWMKEGGLASVGAPRECPAHGGDGACGVGAIFNHTTNTSTFSIPQLDYITHAAEVVGTFTLPSISSYDDLDEDGLVLHSAEVLHACQRQDMVPKAGANYDEFMSGFMDDVDLSSNSSTDTFKGVPLGKLGGALKELREAAMPEAVDHLKEGLVCVPNIPLG